METLRNLRIIRKLRRAVKRGSVSCFDAIHGACIAPISRRSGRDAEYNATSRHIINIDGIVRFGVISDSHLVLASRFDTKLLLFPGVRPLLFPPESDGVPFIRFNSLKTHKISDPRKNRSFLSVTSAGGSSDRSPSRLRKFYVSGGASTAGTVKNARKRSATRFHRGQRDAARSRPFRISQLGKVLKNHAGKSGFPRKLDGFPRGRTAAKRFPPTFSSF